MTRTEPQTTPLELQDALDQIVTKFGAWRVSFAVLARIMTRKRQRLRSVDLSDHLRRDLGINPKAKIHRNWHNYY